MADTYWIKRQLELLKALEKDEEKIKKRLARLYLQDARDLEKEIALYYARYGVDGVIEFRKLLEAADPAQKEQIWQAWDRFIQAHPEYAHLTPARESIYRLNRLEAEQESIRLRAMESAARDEQIITEHLSKVSERTRIGTDIRGGAFHKGLAEIASRPGRVTAGDMWYYAKNLDIKGLLVNDREKMAQYLNTDFAQGIARGDSYRRMAKALSERLQKVSRTQAYGIIYTEGTHVHAEASLESIKADFTEYSFSTYNDNKVCKICRALEDHGPFRIAEAQAGVNFPPLHPFCRCRIEPHVSDWDKWMDDYVARHRATRAEAESVAADFR